MRAGNECCSASRPDLRALGGREVGADGQRADRVSEGGEERRAPTERLPRPQREAGRARARSLRGRRAGGEDVMVIGSAMRRSGRRDASGAAADSRRGRSVVRPLLGRSSRPGGPHQRRLGTTVAAFHLPAPRVVAAFFPHPGRRTNTLRGREAGRTVVPEGLWRRRGCTRVANQHDNLGRETNKAPSWLQHRFRSAMPSLGCEASEMAPLVY